MNTFISGNGLILVISFSIVAGIIREGKAQSTETKPDPAAIHISSPALDLKWTKNAQGWSLEKLTVESRELMNPQGFTTILYSEKLPSKGEVERDQAGDNFSFFFSQAAQDSPTSIHFKHSLPVADVESFWRFDPQYPGDILVTMKLTAKADGYFAIASPTLTAIDKDDLEWGMIPGNWYGRELENNAKLVGMYSQGVPTLPMLANERNSGTLSPMITLKNGITLAVIPEPGTSADPWENDAYSRGTTRVGMSLMNRHNQLTPGLYSPILGQDGSRLTSGETYEFRFRYSIRLDNWFSVFSHAATNIYQLPSLLDLQRNSFSLTDRIDRMLVFLEDGERAAWNTWKVFGYEVGATGTKNADAGTMCMIAHSANDRVMRQRMKYIRNFKLAQQQTIDGFFHGAALGEYGDENGFRSEVGNWIEPLFTTYYTMMDIGNMLLFDPDDVELKSRLRLGADKLMAWQHSDGSWEVGYDVFSHAPAFPDLIDYRPTWYGLLIAYKILGDEKYLLAAKKGADWQKTQGVDRGRYLGVCGDTRNVWDFATAQTSQAFMDLHDITGEQKYRDAGIEAARVYTTSIFTHPIANDRIKKVDGREFKDWEISQAGLGVEHIRGTAAVRGPILLTSYAGLFVRMYEETRDELFLTMARASARGRQAFVGEDIGVSIYYWDSLPHVERDTGKFPWHAFWQIGWITDYLISEAHLRSNGNVKFPGGFMTPKVGPHRTYGFAPGRIFGKEADLIIRQGMIACNNPDVEFITALSIDKTTLYIMAIHQSPDQNVASVSLDLSKISPEAKWISQEILQGDAPEVHRQEATMELTMPEWGMHVMAVEIKE